MSLHHVSLGVLLLPILSSGCILGGTPPGRAELGRALLTFDKDRPRAALRFSAGTHLASALEKNLPVDVGAGYILTKVALDSDENAVSSAGPREMYHGGYFEASYDLQLGPKEWSRTWIGARAEFFPSSGRGFLARWAWEASTFVKGFGSAGDSTAAAAGAVYGRPAFGVFVESGYQVLPTLRGESESFVLSTGISIRFPASLFIVAASPK